MSDALRRCIRGLATNRLLRGMAIPILLVIAWELTSRRDAAHAYAFAPVGQIARSAVELTLSGELLRSLLASLKTASTGLLVGGLAGLLVGSLMAVFRIVDRLIGPLYHSIRQVPLLGWIPLIGLWFGNGEFSKTLIVCLAAFYPMVLNTYEGLKNVEPRFVEVGSIYAFSRWQIFCRIMLPSALPFIVTGVLHALAFSWISTVGAELLFTVGSGLGGLMETAQLGGRMDVIVLCVFSIGVTGFLMNVLFSRLSRRLLRWQQIRSS